MVCLYCAKNVWYSVLSSPDAVRIGTFFRGFAEAKYDVAMLPPETLEIIETSSNSECAGGLTCTFASASRPAAPNNAARLPPPDMAIPISVSLGFIGWLQELGPALAAEVYRLEKSRIRIASTGASRRQPGLLTRVMQQR